MAEENQEKKRNTEHTDNDVATPELPHERDEKPNRKGNKPRKEMKQAAADLKEGLVDTDLHGLRGVEEAVKKSSKPRQDVPKK